MTARFRVMRAGKEAGLMTLSQIIEDVIAGKLEARAEIFLEDDQKWVPIDQFGPVKKRLELQKNIKPAVLPQVKHPIVPSVVQHTLRFENGQAVFELSHQKAERVELRIDGKTRAGDRLTGAGEINVQAGPATQLRTFSISKVVAGEELKIEISAFDAYDNPALSMNGELMVELNQPLANQKQVRMEKGRGELIFKPTKAGTLAVAFRNSSGNGLEARHQVEVVPAAPQQVYFDSPSEIYAGEKVAIVMRALDAYGNPVENFSGDLEISVMNSAPKRSA